MTSSSTFMQQTTSFVRLFFLRAGVQLTLDPSTEIVLIRPMRKPRERRELIVKSKQCIAV